MSKRSTSKHLHPFIHVGLFSPHFPAPDYDGDELEELNILSDVNEIDTIRNYQSHAQQGYDYQDDIKMWIR